jgi:hypothetical protein
VSILVLFGTVWVDVFIETNLNTHLLLAVTPHNATGIPPTSLPVEGLFVESPRKRHLPSLTKQKTLTLAGVVFPMTKVLVDLLIYRLYS